MAFEWKDVGNAVSSAIPVIGQVLGGVFAGGPGSNLGGAAGTAISSLLKSLGLADDSTPDQVMAAISADPQSALKLKMAEMDYQIALGKQKIDEQQIYINDTQNARNMQVETTKVTGHRDTNLYVLAWTIVLGFFGLVGLMFFQDIPKDSNGVVFMLFGALAAAFGSVVGYFFGSSKSSADKTVLLAQAEGIKPKK